MNNHPKNGPVSLHTLLDDNPRTHSLKSGAIESNLISLDIADYARAHTGFRKMVRENAFDFGELAIVTYLQAHEAGKPLTLLPAVIGGRFLHQCIIYNAERGTLTPRDLAGKRIGVRSYTQTTGVWVRGILQNDYGLDPASVQWICLEGAHVEEYRDPPNVTVVEKGSKLPEMLFDGRIDAAMIGPSDLPVDPRIRTVIADPDAAQKAWYEKHYVVPINHIAVVGTRLARTRPDVIPELYRMLLEGRNRDVKPKNNIQMMPFGFENVAPALEMAIDFAHQQGIIRKKMPVEALFDDVTRNL